MTHPFRMVTQTNSSKGGIIYIAYMASTYYTMAIEEKMKKLIKSIEREWRNACIPNVFHLFDLVLISSLPSLISKTTVCVARVEHLNRRFDPPTAPDRIFREIH